MVFCAGSFRSAVLSGLIHRQQVSVCPPFLCLNKYATVYPFKFMDTWAASRNEAAENSPQSEVMPGVPGASPSTCSPLLLARAPGGRAEGAGPGGGMCSGFLRGSAQASVAGD